VVAVWGGKMEVRGCEGRQRGRTGIMDPVLGIVTSSPRRIAGYRVRYIVSSLNQIQGQPRHHSADTQGRQQDFNDRVTKIA
jgi:hypothetical protein